MDLATVSTETEIMDGTTDVPMGRDERAVLEAVELCGGDVAVVNLLRAIWQTEILTEAKRRQGPAWTPKGSMAVQRTLLSCGKTVEANPELVKQVGEIMQREIDFVRKGRK